jgi:MoaA/NifB/PqqE/SkfB family radical SAM enzyme
LLEEAKKAGMITTVTTNCLLYPKYADRLKGKIDMLHFSLDSPDEEEHNVSRGVKCFDKVMESIAIAKANGERPDVLFTVFEQNVDKIERVWKEITQPNGLVLILNPVFDYNSVQTGGSLSEQSLKQLQWWGKQKNVYLNEAFISLRQNGGNHVDNPVCKAASTTLVISPENKLVLPCYHLGTKDFTINNNLYDLYQSAEVQEIVVLEGKLKECEGCVINCYMQPSFAVEINKYFWKALPSTLKYNYIKSTWKQLI